MIHKICSDGQGKKANIEKASWDIFNMFSGSVSISGEEKFRMILETHGQEAADEFQKGASFSTRYPRAERNYESV